MARKRGTLLERLWLTIIVCGQVIVAPAIAFAATYFIDFGGVFGDRALLRVDLVPWILGAALTYGLISLALALTVGGWMPVQVAEKGGWMPVLGASRRIRDASLVDNARLALLNSPHGKMMQTVHNEVLRKNRDLMEVHGGLQMLAAPLQIILAITPLLVLRFVPSEWLIPNRLLELAMLGYIVSLAIILRTFPGYAQRWVGAASSVRRFLVNVTRINWMFPVLLLWMLGRTIVGIAFNWIEPDVSQWQQISLEKSLLEAFLPVDVAVPETSFLDLLVALAVLPLATFTTMATLGGGRQDLPEWLVDRDSNWFDLNPDEDGETLALPAPGEGSSEGEDSASNDDDTEEVVDAEIADYATDEKKDGQSHMLSAIAKAREKFLDD